MLKNRFASMAGAVAAAFALTLTSSAAAGSECEPEWIPTFGGAAGVDNYIRALTVFDDGSGGGPALYAGGNFTTAGGVTVNFIAKWDGTAWSALGSGMGGGVSALAVFDDGAGGGPALYAGGSFTTAGGVTVNNIAKWDGAVWSPLGNGLSGGGVPSVYALTVFDDGSGGGPALYAGGRFWTADGLTVNHIAKWDGTAWSALGGGLDDHGPNTPSVHALTVFDDGSGGGPALYAGGWFFSVGGVMAAFIAKWDGTAWSALGSGMGGTVNALAVFDDGAGGGPALYAGGSFGTAGGVSANRVAKWDGAAWSALGAGISGGGGGLGILQVAVYVLAAFDDAAGGGGHTALYAGGWFTTAGDVTANHIAKWDGTTWSTLSGGMNGSVSALTAFNDNSGGGSALYAGGQFTMAGGMGADYIAKWQGCPTEPECAAADLNCDGAVDVQDLLILLSSWGPCPRQVECPADLNDSGAVDVQDLLILLANWG